MNTTNFNENNECIFNRNYFDILFNLLKNSQETVIKENVLSIFFNLIIDLHFYNCTITLLPLLPGLLNNLLSKDDIDETSINYKIALINLIYQLCMYSVDTINSHVKQI